MKISLNWLSQYLDVSAYTPEKIAEMLTDIGLEVEGIETVESIEGSLEGIIVAEVVSCEKHPNADKLSLTQVDIGDAELLQIVCGAPNVAQGQKVLVATIGTTLYPASDEAFKIKESKIRGQLSQGMICAEDELGLGDDHTGIMVLPDTAAIGTPAANYFKIEKDIVFEIGLTPNRSDATHHIGVAKDLLATLKYNFDYTGNLKMPSVEDFKIDSNELPVKITVENPEACPRYAGISMKGIKVKESPDWIQNRLKAIGVRPVNNVVDATNYVLHEMGQPLHAFDLDKITNREIIVKTLPAGTKFHSLDGEVRTLYAEDLMICDGGSKPMCIGGVFGGIDSGVNTDTANIFLESAHFSPVNIRKSKTRHNLHTDAAFVFEKGSDPNIVLTALKRAVLLIQQLAGGKVASQIVDYYPEPVKPKEVTLKYDHIKRLIGVEIPKEEIKAILTHLGIKYIGETEKNLTVQIPTDKNEVTRQADVIEEILRIYGLNRIPLPQQVRSTMVLTAKPDPLTVQNNMADLLFANGFFEMMTLSLSESKYYRDTLPIPQEQMVFINNTSNVQLDIMRPTMLFSGLEAILRNQNRQHPDLRLFEFGKTYRRKGEKEFEEVKHLSIYLTGRYQPETWHPQAKAEVDFYTLKSIVMLVLQRLGIDNFQRSEADTTLFLYGLKYHRGPQELVSFGRVEPKFQKSMDIKNAVFFADFNWDNILRAIRKNKIAFEALNKFPGTQRDLALVVDKDTRFAAVYDIAKKNGGKILKSIDLFDVFFDEEKLGADKKSYAVRFDFENSQKTLSDEEVDKVMQQLIHKYEALLKASIRS